MQSYSSLYFIRAFCYLKGNLLLLSLFQQTSIFHFAHIVNTVSFAVASKNEKNNRLWQRNSFFHKSRTLQKAVVKEGNLLPNLLPINTL